MEKKIVKAREQTDKKIEKKTDSGDFLRKVVDQFEVKDGINKPISFTVNKRALHDRGDSKKFKTEVGIKYDATKINKAVEANSKSIKQSTIGVNRNRVQTIKNNSKFQSNSTDLELDSKLLKCHTNSIIVDQDAKVKTTDNFRHTESKISGATRISVKEPLHQTSAGRSGRETRNKTKDDGPNKAKVKEVITIPYRVVDDQLQDVEEKKILKTERSTKLRSSVVKPRAVTFKDRNERFPKIVERESKRPDAKSSLKTPNSGKKRRRKSPSTSSAIKNSINESLATEVVKWSPSSVNNHTKPYYEAWVDRSLTAFSKCSEKERLKLEKEIIETLKYFKRPVSPELTYERMNDEAYTGRIKVRRR